MLSQAKTVVQTQESRLQERLEDAKKRLQVAKTNARTKYRKAQFKGTKTIFDVAVNTEPKITAILEHPLLPENPLQAQIKIKIEHFNTPSISDYDNLNVRAILKQIKGMDTWNLLKVDRREKSIKNRKTIFKAIDKQHKRNLAL